MCEGGAGDLRDGECEREAGDDSASARGRQGDVAGRGASAADAQAVQGDGRANPNPVGEGRHRGATGGRRGGRRGQNQAPPAHPISLPVQQHVQQRRPLRQLQPPLQIQILQLLQGTRIIQITLFFIVSVVPFYYDMFEKYKYCCITKVSYYQ